MKKKRYLKLSRSSTTPQATDIDTWGRWRNWWRGQLSSVFQAVSGWIDNLTPKQILVRTLILMFCGYVLDRIYNRDVVIDPFMVPAYFAQEGLTPEVIASRIFDALQKVEQTSNVALGKDNLVTYREEESTPDIEIPGTKVGLKGLIDIAKDMLEVHQLHVAGSIVVPPLDDKSASTQREATVTIYFIDGTTRSAPTNLKVSVDNLDTLFDACAKALLQRLNPLVLAAYETDHGDFEAAITLAARESHNEVRGDSYRSNALSVWGNALSAQGSYDGAIAKYQQAIRLNPQSGGVYLNWGVTLANQRKYTEAIQKFQQALALNPTDAAAYLNWAISLAEEGKQTEALSKFGKTIEVAPNYAFAHMAWGAVLFSQQKYDQAIAELRMAIEINPDDARPYADWGAVLVEQKKYEDAIAKFQKAISLNPSYAEAYHRWGAALAREEKYDDAILKFQKAVSLDPSVGAFYTDWGDVLVDEHKFDEAIQKLRQAFSLGADESFAHDDLGYALAIKGKETDAIEEFQKAIALEPDAALAYMDWGGALAREGKYDDAAEKYHKAVEIDPTRAGELPSGLQPKQEKKLREAIGRLAKIAAVSSPR